MSAKSGYWRVSGLTPAFEVSEQLRAAAASLERGNLGEAQRKTERALRDLRSLRGA